MSEIIPEDIQIQDLVNDYRHVGLETLDEIFKRAFWKM